MTNSLMKRWSKKHFERNMYSTKYSELISSSRSIINISFNFFINNQQIRLIVKHVRKNSLLTQRFVYDNLKNDRKLTLILDVSTKWNSSYDMLLRFKELNTAINWWIENVSNKFADFRLKVQKWHQVRYLIQLFRTFKIIIDFVFRFKIIFIHRI